MRYPLVGGPCDGQRSGDYATKPVLGTVIVCKGVAYGFNDRNEFYNLGAATGGGGGGTLDLKQVGRAWHKLMHVFAVDAPIALNKGRAARKRMRRVVR